MLELFFPKGAGQPGYTSSSFQGLSYLQADFLASSHLTVVAGEFLTPFGTYNERLTPLWIGSFQDIPLIFPLGTMTQRRVLEECCVGLPCRDRDSRLSMLDTSPQRARTSSLIHNVPAEEEVVSISRNPA